MHGTVRPLSTIVPVEGGTMGAYLALPAAEKAPGIVLLQEIFGVNAAMRATADQFAAACYAVLAPDLFWRMEPGVDLGYGDADRPRAFEFFGRFDMARGADDSAAAAAFLKAHPRCNGKVAFIGFCLGGKMAVLAGERFPGVAAVVSFYGVKLQESLDAVRSLKGAFQFHVGDQDHHVPAETIKAVEQAVAGKKDTAVYVYPGAQHAFFNHKRSDVYDAEASKLARGRTLACLQKAFA